MENQVKTATEKRLEAEALWIEFPASIRKLANTNVIVNTIINRFIAGHYLCKEEALCQIIVALVKDNNFLREDIINYINTTPHQLIPRNFIIPVPPDTDTP